MQGQSCLKEFVRYSLLNVLGMIGLSCYILADTFFVSRGLGANGLAALNLAIPVYSFVHGIGLMLGMGGATKFSIFKSQKRQQESDAVFTCILLVSLFSGGLVAVGVLFSEFLTSLLGADAQVFEMANTYLKVILLFSPAFILNDILICFVRNDGNPRLSMLAMLGGSLSNVLLDYIFIFPLGMGIFGAVLATGLASLISMLILLPHQLKKKNGFHISKKKTDFSLLPSALSLGFPSLITELSAGIVIIVFNKIILGLQGNAGVAAYGVIANLSLVVTAIFTGIAQGIQPLVSSAYGHGDRKKAVLTLRYAMTSVAACACAVYLGVFFFADPITGIFNSASDPLLQDIAPAGLRLYFTSALFVGFNITLSAFFTSTERAVPAHILSLLRGLFLIVPMAFTLSALAGITGVWLAFPVTEGLTALLGAFLLFRRPPEIIHKF